MSLNPRQQDAVEHPHDQPLRVVAGAGTGKTFLLTARYLRFVQVEGLAPDRILCLTFTRKAAANMRQRIVRALQDAGIPPARPDALWITTFHSTAWRILLEDPLHAGLPPDTRQITEAERAALQDQVWLAVCQDDRGLLTDTLGPKWENQDLVRESVFSTLAALTRQGIAPEDIPGSLAGTRTAAYEYLRDELDRRLEESKKFKGRADMVRGLDALGDQERAEAATAELLRVAAMRYARACAAAHLLDYDDVLRRAADVCERAPALWRGRFDALLVDECQDTNRAQFRLLHALAAPGGANVTVVGDRKQCIYAFQGARPDNVDDVPGRQVPLDINYRSVGEILNVAYETIRHTAPHDPQLQPDDRWAEAPRVWFTRLPGESEEAAWIAAEIHTLLDADVPAHAIMVLTRTRTRFPALTDAFIRAGIPFEIVDKQAGWDGETVKTALALLRIAVDPLDNVAAIRLLQEPPVALSDAQLYALVERRGHDESLFELLRDAPDKRLRGYADKIARLAARAQAMPGAEFVSFAMREWGLLDHVLAHDAPGRPDFGALARLYAAAVSAFSAVPAPTLAEFVDALRDGYIATRAEESAERQIRRPAVRISNVHQVKGLEFPIVFVAGLGPERFPVTKTLHKQLFGFDEYLGFVQKETWDGVRMARWRVSESTEFPHDVRTQWRDRTLQEEQRLLYVAATRARERLYLTISTPPPKPDAIDAPVHFVERLERWIASEPPEARLLAPDTHAPLPGETEREAITEAAGITEREPDLLSPAELAEHARAAVDRIAWRPPATLDNATVTLSFTQLQAFLHCPRLYEYRYRYGLPSWAGATAEMVDEPLAQPARVSPMVFGTVMHRALELFHSAGAEECGDMSRALAAARTEVDGPWEPYRAKAQPLLEKYSAWDIARAKILACEEPFVLMLEARAGAPAVRVRGVIDRIDGTPDRPVIWDYKTGRAEPAALRDTYGDQLRLYTYALEHALGLEPAVRAGLIALEAASKAEAIVDGVDISAQGVNETLETVRDAAARISAGDFDARGERHTHRPCDRCEYERWCRDRRPGD